jgi:phage tail protein X
MAAYITCRGDVLDAVVLVHYGQVTSAMLITVLDANDGLSEWGPILPGGLTIQLPDITLPSSMENGIALWD